jgi:hypothetical protein
VARTRRCRAKTNSGPSQHRGVANRTRDRASVGARSIVVHRAFSMRATYVHCCVSTVFRSSLALRISHPCTIIEACCRAQDLQPNYCVAVRYSSVVLALDEDPKLMSSDLERRTVRSKL